ncbi:MAG: tRNA lysidine(34) synthetase TilS [Chloroflexota bacterium]|nr:tRNA lysidine(34) synthetase TilS [Chloroflexota bacterium]
MSRSATSIIRRAVNEALSGVIAAGPNCLVVAISGGPDSVCLGHAAAAWARSNDCRLIAAHFDHRLRPDSSADAEFVAGLADAWGIESETGRAEPAPAIDAGRSPEGWARQVRWDFLETCARRHRAAAILTAHQLGDQAETLLLRLLRGSGSAGLSGMPVLAAGFDPPRIRPLLGIRRTAIETYLADHDLPHRTDPSNLEPSTDRNRVRLQVLPLLEQIRPGAQATLARAAENLRAESELLLDLAEAALPRVGCREFFGAFEFDAEKFGQLADALQQLLLRSLCARVSGQIPRRSVLAAAQAFAGGCGPAEMRLAPGASIERSRGRCLLRPTRWLPPAPPPPQKIGPTDPEPVAFLGFRFRLQAGARPGPAGNARLQLPARICDAAIAALPPSTPELAGLPRWRRPATPGLYLADRLVWGLGIGVVPGPLPQGISPAAHTLNWEPAG